ncbi:hypothetical protein ACFYSH_12430 [Streptomyces sp. NPDC005791]|uniref:hypothetical protein n=1 Tax=unclassified Streptomyces TaxID=2593676 RepID=UPI0033D1EC67
MAFETVHAESLDPAGPEHTGSTRTRFQAPAEGSTATAGDDAAPAPAAGATAHRTTPTDPQLH